MFAKILGFALQMVGVLWMFIAGGYGVYRYERLEPGWPNYKVGFLFFHATLHAPGAGVMTAAKAQYAALLSQEAAAARHSAVVVQRQGQITQAAQASAVAVQTRIRTVTRTLIQQVPYAIPPSGDPMLSSGWVRLHDAAALGVPSVAPAAPGADATPSGVHASEALANDIDNYGAGNACRAQLIGLQDWLNSVEAVK